MATDFADLLIVPSTWSKDAYIRSGCKIPVEVVPHALNDEFLRPKRYPKLNIIQRLLEVKQKRNLVYGLFFLWHSGYRKGADLVDRVYREVIKDFPNFILIIKTHNITDPHLVKMSKTGCIILRGWLKDEDLVDLYDICDIYPLFSRGGGFELNGLESLSRGLITLGASEGSWTDYLPKEFQLPIRGRPFIFKDGLPSTIHCGRGVEIDVDKAVDKLHEILNNLDEWKAKAKEYAMLVRRKYNKKSVGKILLKVFEKYLDENVKKELNVLS